MVSAGNILQDGEEGKAENLGKGGEGRRRKKEGKNEKEKAKSENSTAEGAESRRAAVGQAFLPVGSPRGRLHKTSG